VPGALGSIVGVVLPAIGLLILVSLPWLRFRRRLIGGVLLGAFALWALSMTVAANLSDRRDARTREQLARQTAQESRWRSEPFKPVPLQSAIAQNVNSGEPPMLYLKFCADCHGPHGEGARRANLTFPSLLDVPVKPRRTVEDIVSLLKDPSAYSLQPPMRSFSDKLTEQQMREIAQWIVELKR
jgi:mono/diheme cytochrome c family protein